MALTFTKVKRFNVERDGVKTVVYDVTLDNQALNGGWVVTPADFGLKGIYYGIAVGGDVPLGGYVVYLVTTTTGYAIAVRFGDNDAAADGPLVAIPDALAGVVGGVVRFLIKGW